MPRISATSMSVAPLRHRRSAMRAKSGLYGEGRPAGISAANTGLAREVESRRADDGSPGAVRVLQNSYETRGAWRDFLFFEASALRCRAARILSDVRRSAVLR